MSRIVYFNENCFFPIEILQHCFFFIHPFSPFFSINLSISILNLYKTNRICTNVQCLLFEILRRHSEFRCFCYGYTILLGPVSVNIHIAITTYQSVVGNSSNCVKQMPNNLAIKIRLLQNALRIDSEL